MAIRTKNLSVCCFVFSSCGRKAGDDYRVAIAQNKKSCCHLAGDSTIFTGLFYADLFDGAVAAVIRFAADLGL